MGKRHTPKNDSGKRINKTNQTPPRELGVGRLGYLAGNGTWQHDAPPPPPSFLDRLRKTYTEGTQPDHNASGPTPEEIRRTIRKEKG